MTLHQFDSFDSYAAAIHGLDSRVFLLGARDGEWRVGNRDVDGINVQHGMTVVPYLCEAMSSATHLTLLLPQCAPNPAWLNGAPFNQDSLGVLAPGRGFVLRATAPNEWISVTLPLQGGLFTHDSCEAQTLRQWASVADLVKTDYLQLAALRDAALMSMAPSCPPRIGRRLIEQRLRDLIASRLPHGKGNGRPGVSLPLLCESVLTILREARQVVHVDALSKRLKISERSLRDAFQSCFGMSPGHYLALRRLHDVYLDMARNTDAHVTVADCFLRHGYPYSTYAAAQYHALFLETPSQTRRRLHAQPHTA